MSEVPSDFAEAREDSPEPTLKSGGPAEGQQNPVGSVRDVTREVQAQEQTAAVARREVVSLIGLLLRRVQLAERDAIHGRATPVTLGDLAEWFGEALQEHGDADSSS